MGNFRSDNNGLRSDSKGASSHLIEVDQYRRSTKYDPTKPNPVKVSAVTFSGRGKTEVDLHWHTQKNFVISPARIIMNLHPDKSTMKGKTILRNSGILIARNVKVTLKMLKKGTVKRNSRK